MRWLVLVARLRGVGAELGWRLAGRGSRRAANNTALESLRLSLIEARESAEKARPTWSCPACGAELPVSRPLCPHDGAFSPATTAKVLGAPPQVQAELEEEAPADSPAEMLRDCLGDLEEAASVLAAQDPGAAERLDELRRRLCDEVAGLGVATINARPRRTEQLERLRRVLEGHERASREAGEGPVAKALRAAQWAVELAESQLEGHERAPWWQRACGQALREVLDELDTGRRP